MSVVFCFSDYWERKAKRPLIGPSLDRLNEPRHPFVMGMRDLPTRRQLKIAFQSCAHSP